MKSRHARNVARAEGPGFVADLAGQVRRDFIRVVRVHGSGDFHSAGYVGLWAEAARLCRSTIFFAYTRSWRVPEI